ncbi:MAG: DEAD/DEAH box helicase [Candidatus Thorarchaeota archaeon]
MSYVEQPLIKKQAIEFRKYQVNIAKTAAQKDTLVILSTGLGKTVIAALVAAYRIKKYPDTKILFLAPSRPLVDQQARFMKRVLDIPEEKIVCLTGQDSPSERCDIWEQSTVIAMTPQALQNDLIQGRYDLHDVSLIVFDEAHRGVGNYAYTFVAEMYEKQGQYRRALGLTASPGHNAEQVKIVCENLRLDNIEIRDTSSPDVREYIVSIDSDVRYITLPSEIEVLRDILYDLLNIYIAPLKNYGYSRSNPRRLSKREILDLQGSIRREIGTFTKPPKHLFILIRNLTAALRVNGLLEFVGTQGLAPTLRYIQGMYEEIRNKRSSKGVKDLITRSEFKQFENLLQALIAKGHRHPKVDMILEIVSEQLSIDKDSRILVFTRFRDTAIEIADILGQLEEARVSRFVGQSSRSLDKGFSQKQQVQVLEGFRNNEYNVLVATQVGEEGLDIPECNLVVFYDCVPSIVPYIQRRGRTGRHAPGRVIIFVARGTHDEFYHWSVINKLKRMPSTLREAEDAMDETQTNLEDFVEEEEVTVEPKTTRHTSPRTSSDGHVQLIVDSRELPTGVARELARLDIEISGETLEIGDYIASEDVAIERKEANDFIQSLIDGRLFTQLSALRAAYRRPVLIIEGEQIIGLRAVNPAAIYGALASIAIRLQIPILWSRNFEETAQLLYRIAVIEQREEKKPLRTRPGEKKASDAQTLEYILSGFPGVDTVISRALLEEFGTLEQIFNTDEKELKRVRGVGPKIASVIKRLLRTKYTTHQK